MCSVHYTVLYSIILHAVHCVCYTVLQFVAYKYRCVLCVFKSSLVQPRYRSRFRAAPAHIFAVMNFCSNEMCAAYSVQCAFSEYYSLSIYIVWFVMWSD